MELSSTGATDEFFKEDPESLKDNGVWSDLVDSRGFPKADRNAIKEEARNLDGDILCGYCGGVTRPEAGHPNSPELDHRDPYSRGGLQSAKMALPHAEPAIEKNQLIAKRDFALS